MIIRMAAALLLFFVQASGALATEGRGDHRVTLVTAGDSLSQGYGMALSSRLSGTGVRVVNAGRVSSGLAAKKGRDWVDELSGLGRSGASLFILSFGANDAGIPMGGAPFGSPRWEELYSRRVAEAVSAAGAGGARVVLIPVPRMGKPSLEALCARVREVSARAAAAAGAFVAWPEAAAGAGLRASDGVHFTMAGYDAVALAGMEAAWPGSLAILARNQGVGTRPGTVARGGGRGTSVIAKNP